MLLLRQLTLERKEFLRKRKLITEKEGNREKKKKKKRKEKKAGVSKELLKECKRRGKTTIRKNNKKKKIIFNTHILITNDDLLLEIFRRIPDTRSVTRCSLVCKHWFSLINSPHYTQLKQESSSSSLPYTFIFRMDEGRQIFYPLCEYFPDKSKLLYGNNNIINNNNYLSFLPWENLLIFSSFEDLLLFTPDVDMIKGMRRFMICNPFTRQWLALPELRFSLPLWITSAGLVVCNKGQQQYPNKLNQYKYRVSIIFTSCSGFGPLNALTFCSESREWSFSKSFVSERRLYYNPLVACNGMLHWMEQNVEASQVYRVVAFDPFKDSNHPKRFRFIDFPSDILGLGLESLCNVVMVRLRVVKGRLQLSQLVFVDQKSLLKIWELNQYDDDDDDTSWTLVHDVEVRPIFKRPITRRSRLFVVAFHPENANVVFLSRAYSRRIYRYDIEQEKVELVGKFPIDGNKIFPISLRCYTLTHPLWPTLLPSPV